MAAFALGVLLCGCSSYDNPYYVHSVWRPADASDSRADVYFLTDRKPNPNWLPDKFDRVRGDASCGVIQAALPPARRPGGEARFAHETGRAAIACGKDLDAFTARIAAAAHARQCNSVLIYVHGFNTGFETAILRAAQLGNDTQWACAIAAFSWNSAGRRDSRSYDADRAAAAAAEPLFAEFLRALHAKGVRANIIAHSMGTRLVLDAMVHDRGADADEVIFAAPDIGANTFSKLVDSAWLHFRRLTIYVSSDDVALAVSPRLNHGAARLGRVPGDVRGIHSIDVIDASDAPADILGHGYYGLSYEMLADMRLALAGLTAEQRLAPYQSQPPTLERADDGTYKLAVRWQRAPDIFTRFLRWLAASIAG
ncbi:MAG: alpha/beta hydrolase [Proteobacteria bacterium]|nr:alpha/beta hydrolase [Pseudomonadota bacterium]